MAERERREEREKREKREREMEGEELSFPGKTNISEVQYFEQLVAQRTLLSQRVGITLPLGTRPYTSPKRKMVAYLLCLIWAT